MLLYYLRKDDDKKHILRDSRKINFFVKRPLNGKRIGDLCGVIRLDDNSPVIQKGKKKKELPKSSVKTFQRFPL